MKTVDVIIVGSGAAGYTAAIYACRAGYDTLIIAGDVLGGQLTTTSEVENFPSYPDGIDGGELMNRMYEQAENLGVTIIEDMVTKIEYDGDYKIIHTSDSDGYRAKSVIIATGASAKYPDNEDIKKYLELGGVSACATCDGFFYRNEDVVVIGAGDTACEEAITLAKYCNKVTMLVRSGEFKASKIMADRVKSHEKIDILFFEELNSIQGDDSGIKSITTVKGTVVECSGVFVAIGHTPNTKFLFDENGNSLFEFDQSGYMISDMTRTKVNGVFVAGDVGDPIFRQGITAAGSGCQAAIMSDHYLKSL